MSWTVVFAEHAQKDAQKLAASGLKLKAQALLAVIRDTPLQNPPPFEKLAGDLGGCVFTPHQHPAPTCLRGAGC